MSVTQFPVISTNDIPGQLRALAAGIENGTFGEVSGFVYAMKSGVDDVLGNWLGQIGAIEAIGLHHLGIAMVMGQSE